MRPWLRLSFDVRALTKGERVLRRRGERGIEAVEDARRECEGVERRVKGPKCEKKMYAESDNGTEKARRDWRKAGGGDREHEKRRAMVEMMEKQ